VNLTLPTAAMRTGDFSATGTTIYDPLTGNANGTGRQAVRRKHDSFHPYRFGVGQPRVSFAAPDEESVPDELRRLR